MTRERSDDGRRPRQVHGQRSLPIKKELAEGQLHQRQEKHEMTRETADDKRDIR